MQTNRIQRSIRTLLPAGLLVFGLMTITLHQSGYFRLIPGGLGDPIFNNAILEHLFRWVTGTDKSLWSPGFFFPYPGSLAFSDNHFGTGIAYVLARLFGASPETAYIFWYTLAPALNYLTCYYALRNLGLSRGGSATGAFIYAFAFTASAQVAHAQLGYRFAVPLAMLAFEQLRRGAGTGELAKLFIFVTVQFYCSIYIGYFLLLLLGATLVADYAYGALWGGATRIAPHKPIVNAIRDMVRGTSPAHAISMLICFALLAVMFYPYVHYAKVYNFQRGLGEIRSMLPMPVSYLLSDNSLVWGALSTRIANVPMRWEHQMFFGGSACLLALIAICASRSEQNLRFFIALLLLVVLTIQIDGHSIYVLVAHLPLANAVRAVSRVGLIMLFPLALLAGGGFDRLIDKQGRHAAIKMVFCAALFVMMLVEYSTYAVESTSVDNVDSRLTALEARLPRDMAKDAIVYVPFSAIDPLWMTELDGMRLAQRVDRVTINGYSGNIPAGYYDPAISACDVVNGRLSGYASFAHLAKSEYDNLVSRVVIAGEPHSCEPLAMLPEHTHMRGKLSDSIAKALRPGIGKIVVIQGQLVAELSVENNSAEPVHSISDDERPLRLSWRFVDINTQPGSNGGWDSRHDLTSDIATGQTYKTYATVAMPAKEGRYRLELTVVQETVAWLQDEGMPIAKSSQIVVVKSDGTADIVDH